MNNDLFGTAYSIGFVFLVVLAAFIFYESGRMQGEAVRKFIHIMVSNWVFILVYTIDSLSFAIIGPVFFIIVNTIFVYGGYGKYLGMGDRKRDNGLIYYPMTLLILVICLYAGTVSKGVMVASVLSMGYGDGLAALVGKKFGSHKYSIFSASKSLEGSVVMFIVSSLAFLIFAKMTLWYAILLGLFASLLEAVTPLGLDNLTVPLISAMLAEALC